MKKQIFILLLLIATKMVYSQKLKEVNFDSKFKKEYQGNSKVIIHEVKELLHIMIAITNSGLENDDMVNQEGDYYKDVIKHFKPFQNESIILKFDSLIKTNPLNYIFLTGNAISYNFERNNLVKDENYIFPAQSVSAHTKISVNTITTYKKEIEDFAKKSNFRGFYKNHKFYYNQIVNDYNTEANIAKQWKWLENNFESKVNNYTIMCSPLIGGLNYTTSYKDNDFIQIFLVLPTITTSKTPNNIQSILLNTRPIFTEIDHNYVKKPTNDFENQINLALKDREKWVNVNQYGTEYYPNPIKVFDEYMTWSVYLLYVMDEFKNDSEALSYAYNNVNEVMIDRGFPMIKKFNDKLIELRKNNPTSTVEKLYPELIEWCKSQ